MRDPLAALLSPRDGSSLMSKYRRCVDVIYRVIKDEAVVVRTAAAEILALNEVGARILDLLDGGSPLAAVLDRVEQEYDVDRAQLEADAREFLDELVTSGVLETV